MKVLAWLAERNAIATRAETPSPVRNKGEACWKIYSSPFLSIRRSIRNIGIENRARNFNAVRYSGCHARVVSPPKKTNAAWIEVARKNIHVRQTRLNRRIRFNQVTPQLDFTSSSLANPKRRSRASHPP